MADRRVGGRYVLRAPLGRGGMGIVWRATDTVLQREVALKEIRIPAGLSAEERAPLLARTQAEALAAARLNHPNIVTVHDVLIDEDKPWIVMELVEGPTLEAAVRTDGPLTPEATVRLGEALLDAIEAAHAAGVIHRDIKPPNVLLPPGRPARLTDFSIAKLVGRGTLTGRGVVVGTPGYIAPERIIDGTAGPEADLFGLGATLYFAVEGTEAFRTTDVEYGIFATAMQPHRPPERAGRLTPVLDGLLDKNPSARLTVARTRRMLRPGDDPPPIHATLPDTAAPPADTAAPPADRPVTNPLPPDATTPQPAATTPADPSPVEAAPPAPWPRRRRTGVLIAAAIVALLAAGVIVALQYTSSRASRSTPGARSSSSTPSASTAAAGITCAAGALAGSGSAAQGPAVNAWIQGYESGCHGASITYLPAGSGAGQKAFISGTYPFAASDAPLSAANQARANARCGAGHHALHLPMTISATAVVYDLPGVADPRLSPATLARIFTGDITRWDDARIAADNSGAVLPATAIRAVHRSDSTIASDTFTQYLSDAGGAAWTYGHHTIWPAPGGDRVSGAAALAKFVADTPGAIGYVDWSYARVDHLATALVGSVASGWSSLSATSVSTALAAAKMIGVGSDMTLSMSYAIQDPDVYPIASVTYEIVCDQGNPASSLPLLKSFLAYAVSPAGQSAAADLGYGMLPESLRARVATVVSGLA